MMKAGGTEIGKTLAEKSRGLFSANDWQCKTYVSNKAPLLFEKQVVSSFSESLCVFSGFF